MACRLIVDWTPRNKLQLNWYQNSDIFIQENATENPVGKMSAVCLNLNMLKVLGFS